MASPYCPPKEIKQWTALVQALLRHLLNRYGPAQVEQWHFEVWNEPELKNLFWVGTREEYFAFYQATARAIKAVSPQSAVGGPAISHAAVMGSTWLEEFLLYCRENQVPLDFVSLHIYPERFSPDFDAHLLKEPLVDPTTLDLIYHGPDHTYNLLTSARTLIKKTLGFLPRLYVTEWNASAFNRNLIHDTAYVAAFIVHHVVRCRGLVDMLGYWTFTDINEEDPPGAAHFHGNFGLINKDGIKKAAYFAYFLLAKLGEEILDQGEGYLVTKSRVGVQVLLYHYAYFDPLFLAGDTSLLTPTERYRVFENKREKHVTVTLQGLVGPYKITRYRLNRTHGSAFDEWLSMGAPEKMSAAEIKYLKHRSYPEMTVEEQVLNGRYQEITRLPVHGVQLVCLEKKY